MRSLIILAIACLFVAVAARSIKALPWLWYSIAAALDIVYAYGIVFTLPPAVLHVLSIAVQRATFATALFVIVMYIGVFSEQSLVRRTIGSIRAELSIIACILVLAHCLNYLISYAGVLTSHIEVISGNQLASLIVAIVLFVLLILLGVTSIKAVKHRMKAATWKKIQGCSYIFFALIFIHQLLILYPSAIKGSGDSLLACITTGVVFLTYFIVRFVKYLKDKKSRLQAQSCSEREGSNGVHFNQA